MTGRGKDSYFVCDRSGFKTRYEDGMIDPGTGLWIRKDESDGRFGLKNHPQTKPPKWRKEGQGLKNARPGRLEARLHWLTDETGAALLTDGDLGNYLIKLEDSN